MCDDKSPKKIRVFLETLSKSGVFMEESIKEIGLNKAEAVAVLVEDEVQARVEQLERSITSGPSGL